MQAVNYKLRVSVQGVEVEVMGDKSFVEKNFNSLTEKYLTIKKGTLPVHKRVPSGQGTEERSEATIHDFVGTKKPKDSATELMPVLVYYAEHFEALEQFNESDVKKLYRRYDISKRPKNIYQAILDISRNKGYFESVPKKRGYFKLTEAGEHFVETKLPRE